MTKIFVLLLALSARTYATTYTLVVSTTGPKSPSVVFSSNPATGINCGSSSTACSMVVASGTFVTLTEVSASTVVFAGWTYANGCATNKTTCRLSVIANTTIGAAFNPVLELSLHGNGLGAIAQSSTAINCTWFNGCARGGKQRYNFPKGTVLVLSEVVGASSTFTGWSGDAGCNTASTCTVTLNGYEAIVATFSSTGPFTIKVNVRGLGRVRSSPTGINCGNGSAFCSAEFSSGTAVSLSTLAAAGYYFSGWADGTCSGRTPCVVVSSSVQQGLGGAESPSAFFYKSP